MESLAHQDHMVHPDAEDYLACLGFLAPRGTEGSLGLMELKEMWADPV